MVEPSGKLPVVVTLTVLIQGIQQPLARRRGTLELSFPLTLLKGNFSMKNLGNMIPIHPRTAKNIQKPLV